jgi:dolichol-phosphate mannosyltransferase
VGGSRAAGAGTRGDPGDEVIRCLVTGAAGFVGANLVRRLIDDGHDVSAILQPLTDTGRLDGLTDLRRLEGDIADRGDVERAFTCARPEWIFHLAAHGAYSFQTDVVAMARSNVVGMATILAAAERHGCTVLLNTGTSSEYGDRDHAPREDEPPQPNSDYAATKAAATWLCQRARSRGVPVTTLRLYSAYGPFEEERRLIPTLVRAALAGTWPPLASPTVVRDYVYVGDVIDAYIAAASSPYRSTVYNVASGIQTSLAELVSTATKCFSIRAKPEWGGYPERLWDTRVWVGDPALIQAELGWAASTSLSDGLTRTAVWLAAHPLEALATVR